jgi:hypothetical protein
MTRGSNRECTGSPLSSTKLNESNIVILLVTSHFFGSVFCVTTELVRAREREKEGVCDLVPVLVEPCDYEAHEWIRTLQLLPPGRPVAKFRPTSEGWTKVAEGIRWKIDNLMANRPVSQTLDCRGETVHSGQMPLKDEKRTGFQEFENVSAFWRAQPQFE